MSHDAFVVNGLKEWLINPTLTTPITGAPAQKKCAL
jgi:hypothetical protein